MKRRSFLRDGIGLSVTSSGAGTPFLFQHGLCGDASQPADVFPDDAGFECLTLESRGHGLSDCGQDSFSIAQFTDDLAAWIENMDVGAVPVGGISMGAAIAIRLTVTRPELVRALVLARPAWISQPAPENLCPNRQVARLLAAHPPEDALRLFKVSDLFVRLQQQAPDNLISLSGFFDKDRAARSQPLLEAIANDGPDVSREGIAAITCPTLVIGTARDVIHPLEMAMELANLIPDAQFVEITSKADSPAAYRSDFRAALREFLMEIN